MAMASGTLTVLRVALDKCRSLSNQIFRDAQTRLEGSSYLVLELRSFLQATKRISERVLQELPGLRGIEHAETPKRSRNSTPAKKSRSVSKHAEKSLITGLGGAVSNEPVQKPPTIPISIVCLPNISIPGRLREEAKIMVQERVKHSEVQLEGKWKA